MCTALVDQLAIELARYIASVNEPTEKGGLASWRLRIIDERLAEPREPPTLAELAELCRMSVRQLTRGFRTSRGCSVGDHLAEVRIDAAKRRLSSSQESIKTIATSLGFSSQSSFTAAFRRATGGVTPNEYRKRAGRARALAERQLN
jgi:AraC family transcriptional regulator